MVLSSAAETLFEDFFSGSYTETYYHVTLSHTTGRITAPLLLIVRQPENVEFEVMPAPRREIPPATTIPQHNVVGRPKEVRNGIPILRCVSRHRHHAMDGRQEPAPGQEPQRVANVDDGTSGARRHVEPALAAWQQDLQPALFGQQEGQGADVRVLVVALRCRLGVPGVAEQGEGAAGPVLRLVAFHQEAVGGVFFFSVLEERTQNCQ